jgi:hypothetical protein
VVAAVLGLAFLGRALPRTLARRAGTSGVSG